MQHRLGAWPTAIAFVLALTLFSADITLFAARVTDLGALRILRGQVPYRDFWTIYSPGSFYVVAGGFAVFGKHVIVGNILGAVTAAAAVAVFFRLGARMLGVLPAAGIAALFAVAFTAAGYQVGFESYPPAILGVWVAASRIACYTERGRRRDLVAAGVALGIVGLCKHDLGAYGCVASALALVLVQGSPLPLARRLGAVVALGAIVLAVMAPPVLTLSIVAGDDMVRDLVVYPLTDFPWAREEDFPGLLPSIVKSRSHTAFNITHWFACNAPIVLVVASLPLLWRIRSELRGERGAIAIFALVAFPLFWNAAHVQINTHVVSFGALAALLGAAGLLGTRARAKAPARWRRRLFAGLLLVWALDLAAVPGYRLLQRIDAQPEPIGLPHLAGLTAAAKDVVWMRDLARAMREAAPPEHPLFVASRRNDVLIYCEGDPYWLSDRKIATRHHELHPGITDTEPYQREMIRDLEAGPLPVLLREHRFDDAHLDKQKQRFLMRLAVGATLLDEWIEERYRPGRRFGPTDAEGRFKVKYELMEPRTR